MRLILTFGGWTVADLEVLDPLRVLAIVREARQEEAEERPPIGFRP